MMMLMNHLGTKTNKILIKIIQKKKNKTKYQFQYLVFKLLIVIKVSKQMIYKLKFILKNLKWRLIKKHMSVLFGKEIKNRQKHNLRG